MLQDLKGIFKDPMSLAKAIESKLNKWDCMKPKGFHKAKET